MIILVKLLQGHCPSGPNNTCTDLTHEHLVTCGQGTEVLVLCFVFK